MENKQLKIIIAVLIILVLGLSSYIIYDKVLSNNEQTEKNNNINGNENNDNIDNSNLTDELKEIFDLTYEYYESVVAYCGEFETTDRVSEGGSLYYVSTNFKTYDEMFEYLKRYMSEDVISKKYPFSASNKEYYLEENGKLYCATFGKGGAYTYGDSSIEIITQEENKIIATATKELIDPNGEKVNEKINVIFEKNNNNWIITSYEELD